MKHYFLNIKSHTDAPDFEMEVFAETLEEAIKTLFENPALADWDEETLEKYITEVNI